MLTVWTNTPTDEDEDDPYRSVLPGERGGFIN